VIEDDFLITSRGAGTALDFGLALVGLLAGKKAVNAVSAAIMA
jgi:4-methyl-5(b-hydroxyethyl)-thiazole monophosphate biosynthesis